MVMGDTSVPSRRAGHTGVANQSPAASADVPGDHQSTAPCLWEGWGVFKHHQSSQHFSDLH